MKKFSSFIRILFNCLGLCCYSSEGGKLKVSNAYVMKTKLVLLVTLIIYAYMIIVADLTNFLPEGYTENSFSDFSVGIFRMISVIPGVTGYFIIVNHVTRRYEILELIVGIK